MVKTLVLAVSLALLSPATPESVTLSVDRAVVTYGDPVHLSLVVEPPAEPVAVVGLPYDGGVYPAEPVPDGAGRWSVEDRPRITTQYRARAVSVDSAEAPVVEVRPRVHLVVISARRGLFYTRAQALRSYRDRMAWLQRRTSRGWKIVERVRLGPRSVVRFFASLPDGRSRVRIVVETAPGYVRGISRVAVIRR